MTAEKIPHSGSKTVSTLSGPSSQILKIDGIGRQQITWSTEDREAMELEIRARLVSTTAGVLVPAQQPLIQYELEIGHGKAVWHRPALPTQVGGSSLSRQLWTMPMRGLYLRLSARQLRFSVECHGDFAIPPVAVASSKVEVSFQPVLSSHAPVFPRSHLCRPGSAFGVAEFPMEANEFRVRNPSSGLAFAAGATFVIFSAFNGGAIGAAGGDAAAYADWTPIPVIATGYTTSIPAAALPILVEFR